MNEGLRRRTPSMCQVPTYITRVADGTEKGLALAVDLGGTNLRVCSVDLHGDNTYSVLQSNMPIPREVMVGERASLLFSFIARRVMTFLETYHQDCLPREPQSTRQGPRTFNLGFTFSYPAYQTGINSGTLLHWAKGFDIPEAVGKDPCKLLQDEIDLLHLPVRVTALVNDAAGTIMSRAYTLPASRARTSIGVIVGTGSNSVYLEKLSKVTKPLEGQYDRSAGEMLMSIEWGSFNNHLSVIPNTSYDTELNQFSVYPGDQMFEKRFSGMYLGELLRIVLLSMHRDPKISLFYGITRGGAATNDKPHLYTRWSVDSSILSVAEGDDSNNLETLRRKIEETLRIPADNISIGDAHAVKEVAHALGKRAARLVGMALGAVVLQSEQLTSPVSTADIAAPEHGIIDVAVDGSVFEHFPGFETYMREAMRAVDGIGTAGEKRIRISIAKDGSSVGAAIIALLAAQQAEDTMGS
ncbi:MAG: glucokinase [Geoglossum umbratile]|nr:MAG: glucokinase [Geoglossum umbratile]